MPPGVAKDDTKDGQRVVRGWSREARFEVEMKRDVCTHGDLTRKFGMYLVTASSSDSLPWSLSRYAARVVKSFVLLAMRTIVSCVKGTFESMRVRVCAEVSTSASAGARSEVWDWWVHDRAPAYIVGPAMSA
jgi:hypothetical protein